MYFEVLVFSFTTLLIAGSFFSCDQAALRTPVSVCQSVFMAAEIKFSKDVRPSVCLSHHFHYVPVIVSS